MNANITEYLYECLSSITEGMSSMHFDLYTTMDGYGVDYLDEVFGQQLNSGIEIKTTIKWDMFLEEFKHHLESIKAKLRIKGINVVTYGFVDGDLEIFHVQ